MQAGDLRRDLRASQVTRRLLGDDKLFAWAFAGIVAIILLGVTAITVTVCWAIVRVITGLE